MKNLNYFKDTLNEAYKVKANRKLGKTKSGKIVYSNKQEDVDTFDLQDYKDAKELVWAEIQRLKKLGRNSGNVFLQLHWLNDRYGFRISKLDGTFNKEREKPKEDANSKFFKRKFQKDGSKPWDDIA